MADSINFYGQWFPTLPKSKAKPQQSKPEPVAPPTVGVERPSFGPDFARWTGGGGAPRWTPPEDEHDESTMSPMRQVNAPEQIPGFNPATMSAMRQVNEMGAPSIETTREAPPVPGVRNAAAVAPLVAPWLDVAQNAWGLLPELGEAAAPYVAPGVSRRQRGAPTQLDYLTARMLRKAGTGIIDAGEDAAKWLRDKVIDANKGVLEATSRTIPAPLAQTGRTIGEGIKEQIEGRISEPFSRWKANAPDDPQTFAQELQKTANLVGIPGLFYGANRFWETMTGPYIGFSWLNTGPANYGGTVENYKERKAELVRRVVEEQGKITGAGGDRRAVNEARRELAKLESEMRGAFFSRNEDQWQEQVAQHLKPGMTEQEKLNARALWELQRQEKYFFGATEKLTPEQEKTSYTAFNEQSPVLVNFLYSAMVDPLDAFIEPLAAINDARKIAKAAHLTGPAMSGGRGVQRVLTYDEIAKETNKLVQQANSFAGRHTPWQITPESLAHSHVIQSADTVTRISEAARDAATNNPDLIGRLAVDPDENPMAAILRAFLADPDNPDIVQLTGGFSQSRQAKRTVILMREMFGTVDDGTVAKMTAARAKAMSKVNDLDNIVKARVKDLEDLRAKGAVASKIAKAQTAANKAQQALIEAKEMVDKLPAAARSGDVDFSKLQKIMDEAKGDDLAAVSALAQEYESAAKRIYATPITKEVGGMKVTEYKYPSQRSAMRKFRGNVSNAVSIMFLGTNPGYAFRNAANNLFTAVVDGVSPIQRADSLRELWTRWGPAPWQTKQGLGTAGDMWKSREKAQEYLRSISEPMRLRDVFKAIETSTLKDKLSYTLQLGQNFERYSSERIMAHHVRNYWQQVWPKTVRRITQELESQGFTRAQVQYLQRRLDPCMNPQEVRAEIEKFIGGPGAGSPPAARPPAPSPAPVVAPSAPTPQVVTPTAVTPPAPTKPTVAPAAAPDARLSVPPEVRQEAMQAGGPEAVEAVDEVIAQARTPEEAVARLTVREAEMNGNAELSAAVEELRATTLDVTETGKATADDLKAYLDRGVEIVRQAQEADAALIKTTLDVQAGLDNAARDALWQETRAARRRNRIAIMRELDELDVELMPELGFDDAAIVRQSQYREYVVNTWDKSDTLINNFWRDKRNGMKGATAGEVYEAMQRERQHLWDDLHKRRNAHIDAFNAEINRAIGNLNTGDVPPKGAPKPPTAPAAPADAGLLPQLREQQPPANVPTSGTVRYVEPDRPPTRGPGYTDDDIRTAANAAGIATTNTRGDVPNDKWLLNFARKNAGVDVPSMDDLTDAQRVALMDALYKRATRQAELRVEPKAAPPPKPVRTPGPAIEGRETHAYGVDATQPYNLRFKVVELDDLIVSHDDAFRVNPEFPAELQPRDRTAQASKSQVDEIVNTFNPDWLIVDHRFVEDGPMVVRHDNVVLAGNGRSLALRYIRDREPQKLAAYQAKLRQSAGEFGIDRDKLAGMKTPILVRELDEDGVDLVQFARESNDKRQLAASAAEDAINDAARISDNRIAYLAIGDSQTIDGALLSPANKGLVDEFINSFSVAQRGALIDGEGKFSPAGRERLKNALLAKTFQSEIGKRLAAIFIDSADPQVKTIEAGVYGALGKLAKMESAIRSGEKAAEFSLEADLAAAIEMLARLRQQGFSVREYLHADEVGTLVAMHESELTELQEKLLAHLDYISRRQKMAREFLSEYADTVMGETPNMQQMDMFGGIELPTDKEGILDDIITRQQQQIADEAAKRGATAEVPVTPRDRTVEAGPRESELAEEVPAAAAEPEPEVIPPAPDWLTKPAPEAPRIELPTLTAAPEPPRVETAPQPSPAQVVKQPWEMTRDEFAEAVTVIEHPWSSTNFKTKEPISGKYRVHVSEGRDYIDYPAQGATKDEAIDWARERYIKGKAMGEGVTIPDTVLADYPDLAVKAPALTAAREPGQISAQNVPPVPPMSDADREAARNLVTGGRGAKLPDKPKATAPEPPTAAPTTLKEAIAYEKSLGSEGRKVWKQWQKNMGKLTPEDRDWQEAQAWFDELYNGGKTHRAPAFKSGGMPLDADERRAIDAGKMDGPVGASRKPVPEPKAKAAAETMQPQPTSKEIGKNYEGNTLYEDNNGVRSYVRNGIRISEPVSMIPTRSGVEIGVNHHSWSNREFLLPDEYADMGGVPQGWQDTSAWAAKPKAALTDEPLKKGDRVVTQKGEHGVIEQVDTVTMSGYGGIGGKETRHTYYVKTDKGRTVYESPENLTREVGPAPEVIPDPVYGGRGTPPDHLWHIYTYDLQKAKDAEAAAARAKKPSMIASHKQRARSYRASSAEAKRIFDEWAAQYPEEAAKVEGYAKATAKPVATPPAIHGPDPADDVATSKVWTTDDRGRMVLSLDKGDDFQALPKSVRDEIHRFFVYSPSRKGWLSKGQASGSNYQNIAKRAGFMSETDARDAARAATADAPVVPAMPTSMVDDATEIEQLRAELAKSPLTPGETEFLDDYRKLMQTAQEAGYGTAHDWFESLSDSTKVRLIELTKRNDTTVREMWDNARAARGAELRGVPVSLDAPRVETPEDAEVMRKAEEYQRLSDAWNAQVDETNRAIERGKQEAPEITRIGDLELIGKVAELHDAGKVTDEEWAAHLDAMYERHGLTRRGIKLDEPQIPTDATMEVGGTEDVTRRAATAGSADAAGEATEEIRVDDPGVRDRGTLEGVPAEEVRPPEGGGQATESDLRRPGVDEERAGGGDQRPGHEVRRGLGDGEGGESLPASRGTGAGEAVAPEATAQPAPDRSYNAEGPRSTTAPDKPGRDYVIRDSDGVGVGGKKGKANANIEAIRLLKQLEKEGRLATPEEQAVLVKYTGWGGIKEAFDSYKALGPEEWDNVTRRWVRKPGEWAKEYNALKELLTDAEYSRAFDSTLNAHFTSLPIIDGMWAGIRRLGFKGGNMLEPAGGIGHFFGRQPADLASKSKRVLIEIDPTTAGIAKHLYQNANTYAMGYQDAPLPRNWFNLAISNVPFAEHGVSDPWFNRSAKYLTKHVHDYYFAKTLEVVKPGGIIAFITSKGTMDKVDDQIRRYVSERADLLMAVRLPEDAFTKNAGATVTTDIIFLRKRMPGELPNGESWTELREVLDPSGQLMPVNEYYQRHPENILGQMQWRESGRYGPGQETAVVSRGGDDLAALLNERMGTLPENVMADDVVSSTTVHDAGRKATLANQEGYREGKRTVSGGRVHVNRGGMVVDITDDVGGNAPRVKGMVQIRDAAEEVRRLMLEDRPDAEIKAAQKKLNTAYDQFTKRYGPLNGKANVSALADDPDLPNLLALEDWDRIKKKATKMDLFNGRPIRPAVEITSAESAKDALVASLMQRGRVDMDYMAKLYGKPVDEIATELTGRVFKNPEGDWELSDTYLSGNVRAKLKAAQAAAQLDPLYQVNVDSLLKVQPQEIPIASYSENDFMLNIGDPSNPPEVIARFIKETLDYDVAVRYSGNVGAWQLSATSGYSKYNEAIMRSKWGTKNADAIELLSDAMNSKQTTVRVPGLDANGKRTMVYSPEDTLAAREKQEQLMDEWGRWWRETPGVREQMTEMYNDRYNFYTSPVFDGAHLMQPGALPGLTATYKGKPFEWRKYQADAIWRIITQGNTLLAHVVGAGKTNTMIAAGMELRRLGLAKKPVYVVPNHLVKQWNKDFIALYPGAKVLAATSENFDAAHRKVFTSQMATGDWDAIIIGHDSFKRLPVSREAEAAFIQEQINTLAEWLDENATQTKRGGYSGKVSQASQTRKNDPNVRQVANQKKKLEERLKKLLDQPRDDNITFEETGIDQIFVDEGHKYKNLWYNSSLGNVKGLGTREGNDLTTDMFIKVQQVVRRNNGRGVVFATGTPVSNSMVELYNIMRYMQYDTLQEAGLKHFDAWQRSFGRVQTTLEATVTGGYKMTPRLRKFNNYAGLRNFIDQFSDILAYKDITPPLPRPKILGGAPRGIEIEPSNALTSFVQYLQVRAAKLSPATKKQDNMLKITSEAKAAALDMRLVDPSAPDLPGSKLNIAADNIHRIYKETHKYQGTQLVFCDISTPKAKASDGFSAYDELKAKLIARGIPKEQIAFIHSAKNDKAKDMLFEAVRDGDIRVLIGSTDKMGAGTNVQDRMAAIHHLDVPWRASDVEQRNGRLLRPGNMHIGAEDGYFGPDGKPVEILQYVSKGSLDEFLWQLVEAKARVASEIMSRNFRGMTVEVEDDIVLSAAQMRAIASGKPEVMEKIKIEADLVKLQSLRTTHYYDQAETRKRVEVGIPSNIASGKQRIAGYQKSIDAREAALGGKGFHATIAGKVVGLDSKAPYKDVGAAILEVWTEKLKPIQNLWADLDKRYKIAKEAAYKSGDAKLWANTQFPDTEYTMAVRRLGGTDRKVGTYAGADIVITDASLNPAYGPDWKISLQNPNTGKSTSQVDLSMDPSSIGTSIRDLSTWADREIKFEQEYIGKLEAELKTLKGEVGKPFAKEAEYQKLRKRNSELEAILNPDKKQGIADDLAGDLDGGDDAADLDFDKPSRGGMGITAPGTPEAQELLNRIFGRSAMSTGGARIASAGAMQPVWAKMRSQLTGAPDPLPPITPDQARILRELANKKIIPNMVRDKAAVANLATQMRNFALGDYADKRMINEWLAYIMPWSYWYTFTYPNWAQRLATNPSWVSNYARYKTALAKANREYYKAVMDDQNAEMSEYWEDQIRVPFAGTQLYFDLERTLMPLQALLNDFESRTRNEAPGGEMMTKIGEWGPSLHPLITWAYAAWLSSQGYREASDEWVGYLFPWSRALKGATALAREAVPGLQGIIPAGGFTPEQLFLQNVKGGDTWERRRIGYALYTLWKSGEITEEQFQDAAYKQSGEAWDMARQVEAVKRAPGNLGSYLLGAGFKARDLSDIEIDRMNKEWGAIWDARYDQGVDEAVWRKMLAEFEQKYPFKKAVSMARETDSTKRLEDYAYSIIDRLPPGQEYYRLLEESGLSEELLDRFKADKGDTSKWKPYEVKAFQAAIEKLADMIGVPSEAQKAEYGQYWTERDSIRTAVEKATGHTYAEYTAANDEYNAEGADKKAVLAKYPWLKAGWDAKDKAKAASPTYQKYNPATGKATTATQSELSAKYDAAEKQFGAQVAGWADAYSDLPKEGDARKKWREANPEKWKQVSAYYDFIYGDTRTGSTGRYVPLYPPRKSSYGGRSYGGGGRSYGTPTPTEPAPSTPTEPPAYETWTADDLSRMVQEERTDDPAFDTFVGLLFGTDTMTLADKYYSMSAEERAAWIAKNPQAWARLLKYLLWLMKQTGVKTDYSKLLASIPGNAPNVPGAPGAPPTSYAPPAPVPTPPPVPPR